MIEEHEFVRRRNTQNSIMRLWFDEKIDSGGFYLGHHLIGRNKAINNGVLVGQTAREAIYVDFDNSPTIQKIYQEAKQRSESLPKSVHPPFLQVAYDIVQEYMQFDDSPGEIEISRILKKYNNHRNDELVSLEIFVKEGWGNCRYRSPFAAVMLERAVKEGILTGKTSIDRSTIGIFSHAWVRHTFPSGKIYILNVSPPNHYIGTLESTIKQWQGWAFYREGEDVLYNYPEK